MNIKNKTKVLGFENNAINEKVLKGHSEADSGIKLGAVCLPMYRLRNRTLIQVRTNEKWLDPSIAVSDYRLHMEISQCKLGHSLDRERETCGVFSMRSLRGCP